MKILVIYNPTSGKGKSKYIVREIIENLDELKFDYLLYESQSKNDLVEYVERNCSHYNAVFGVGGDGTLRDIALGIQRSNINIPLGVFPAGSGNDLIKSLNLEEPIKSLVDKYLKRNVDSIYACQCNEATFINIAGIGIDVDILQRRLKLKKYFTGSFCYAVAAVQALFLYKPKKYKIILDDKVIEDEMYIVTIANGKYEGGGMKISPNADLRDKKLNIIMLRKVGKYKLIKAFSKIYKGNHIDLPFVEEINSETIQIDFLGRNEYINHDGDLLKGSSLKANKNISKALKILI